MDADGLSILLPCAICGRTFSPDSLERHNEICAKNRVKKRRPFDSAKQRVQGTELAEFLPKQDTRRHQDEKGHDRTSWKKKHNDLLRTIREARGEIMDSHKQSDSLISSGAPTRANEKGTCPTCNRHFGIKAYDRHVAWCKNRITRVSVNAATNLAKERLEARIGYRAPTLKNRRAVTREKYSPGSTANQSTKASLSAPALSKPKENSSVTNYNRENPIKQKPAIVRRPGQRKESLTSPGPMKSRLIDRTNRCMSLTLLPSPSRPTEDHDSPSLSTSCRLAYATISSRRPPHFPVPPIRLKNNDSISANEITTLPIASSRKQFNRNETISNYAQNDETRNREICFARIQRNIVSARSQGHPKLNNVAVNNETLGVTIQPCTIHKDTQKDDQLITWKQINYHNDDGLQDDGPVIDLYSSQQFHQFDRMEDINIIENMSETEEDLSMPKDNFTRNRTEIDLLMTKKDLTRLNDDVNKIDEDDDNVTWVNDIQNLNQTYLIKDSDDIEQPEIVYSNREAIKHNPRVEFYLKNATGNKIESYEKKLEEEEEEEIMVNNEEIRIAGRKMRKLMINDENKENGATRMRIMEESMIDEIVREDNKEASNGEIAMTGHKAEKLNIKGENEKRDRAVNNENVETAELDVREAKINIADKKDSQIVDDENTAGSEKFDVNETDKEDHRITTDKITDADYIEAKEMEQDVISTQNISKEFKESYSKKLKVNSTTNNDFISDQNFEMLAAQNSTDNSNKSEDIENNVKDEKRDFNEDSDNCSDSKARFFDHSVAKRDIKVEGLLVSNVNINFDYDNDGTMCVEEHNTRGADDLQSSIILKNGSRRCCKDASPNTNDINLPRRVHGLTKRIMKVRHQVNSPEMKHKIRENMNLLGGSTDSLISVEFVELASIKRPEANSTYEKETIEIIRPSRRNRMFPGHFPDIRSELAETKENSEKSYWEKATKISQSEPISLDSSSDEAHKFTRRNPRVRILPPVANQSLINHRKIVLSTRPAWCSYVRRRPDFNLVLKARTGTYENYDPFLLAEQQLKDLLSDTSDQSMTRSSPTLQQTRDTLYPLSHSSAFVKYPCSDKRASLIAPPSEFDDLISDFSSDSTETNSITREVFLKSNILANNKDVTDSTSPKPAKELGRRVIIDKSKALGVDEHLGTSSTDKPYKVLDNVTTKPTKSTIGQTNSIRASSAPRTSNRKTLGDVRKAHGSKIIEGQRSSDQRLNQRNNSSLSGSNLSLSSIVSSSEPDIKRSNSMFDELMTSFEEDVFPDLRSFRYNESFDLSSPGSNRQRNGNLINDEELFSPDSYKPQDHSKLSNDSAYSSLNRKYSHHGRSSNDMAGRFDEDVARNGTSPIQTATKCKMSRFCHECGQRFPETAKFCCECGVRRLAL